MVIDFDRMELTVPSEPGSPYILPFSSISTILLCCSFFTVSIWKIHRAETHSLFWSKMVAEGSSTIAIAAQFSLHHEISDVKWEGLWSRTEAVVNNPRARFTEIYNTEVNFGFGDNLHI